jgi:hypothetical protein
VGRTPKKKSADAAEGISFCLISNRETKPSDVVSMAAPYSLILATGTSHTDGRPSIDSDGFRLPFTTPIDGTLSIEAGAIIRWPIVDSLWRRVLLRVAGVASAVF